MAAALVVVAVRLTRRRSAALAAAGIAAPGPRRRAARPLAEPGRGPAAGRRLGRTGRRAAGRPERGHGGAGDGRVEQHGRHRRGARAGWRPRSRRRTRSSTRSPTPWTSAWSASTRARSPPRCRRPTGRRPRPRCRTSGSPAGRRWPPAILGSLSAITGKTVTVPENGALPDLGYWGSATIVLFSDGGDSGAAATRRPPPTAATLAQNAGVHIETVGVGTAAGANVEVDGFQLHTALDTDRLTAARADHRRRLPPGLRRRPARRRRLDDRPAPDRGQAGRPAGRRRHRPRARAPRRRRRAHRPPDGTCSYDLHLALGPAVAAGDPAPARADLAAPPPAPPGGRTGHLDRPGAGRAAAPDALGAAAAEPAAPRRASRCSASARPARRPACPVASDSTTIMLAMDVSGSMCATDVDPNRITVAQQAAIRFIEAEGGKTRIGLVAFAGVAGLQVPADHRHRGARSTAINGLSTARGTAIGSAIMTSVDGIAAVDPTVAPSGVDAEAAQRLRLRPGRDRRADRRREHPGRRAGDRRRDGRRTRRPGLHDRLRHDDPDADGVHRPAGGRLGRRGWWLRRGGRGGFGGGRSPLVIDEEALEGGRRDHRRRVLPGRERRPADPGARRPAEPRDGRPQGRRRRVLVRRGRRPARRARRSGSPCGGTGPYVRGRARSSPAGSVAPSRCRVRAWVGRRALEPCSRFLPDAVLGGWTKESTDVLRDAPAARSDGPT